MLHHLFTVDLEDWYCTRAVSTRIKRSDWAACQSRVLIGTMKILDILDTWGIEATFFVLGYIAEREPWLIKEIASRGHEIASHGYNHRSLDELLPSEFEMDLRRSVEVIEELTGEIVRGYRAPNFSITDSTSVWAYEAMRDTTISYDSSVFPGSAHPAYNMKASALDVYTTSFGLLEAPVSCVKIGRFLIPATGGGYFRHAPFWITERLFRRISSEGRSAMFYIHPWELDPEQPRLSLPWLQQIRQYHGIKGVEHKIELLTHEFRFTSIRKHLSRQIPSIDATFDESIQRKKQVDKSPVHSE